MLSSEQIAEAILAQRLPLTAFIATVTRDFHLAEDIFQEVCVKAVGRADQFETAEHALHWVRVAGRHRAVDVLRAQGRVSVGLSEELLATLAGEWVEADGRDAVHEALERCLQKLTRYNRELLRLRYFERRSGTEVAAALGRKLETIYQALARVHQALGECVRREISRENLS